ncbi:kinase [Lithospermum erythrorhizon]|uniref:Kinase n=1 Tax=Lithospermum erythrorhizon TaxID=34254 RepID=A0AAV3S3L9_LITER
MGDGPRGIKIYSDHFQISASTADSPQSSEPRLHESKVNRPLSCSRSRRKSRTAASMLKLFSLRGLTWGGDQEKVVLSATEVASLRSEISDLEERELHLKAQLEHLDEILKSALLSGYLFMRTRWAALPGEPLPLDDTEVDDWLPRFLVLQGSCIYLYLSSTELSPQDSTLLSDVTEVGPLPCEAQDNEETRYYFYILTRHGLRYECYSVSKIQVDSWVAALETECKLGSHTSSQHDLQN